ncbi:hypothetical protein PINS_up018329 [Pythium insidiosum]|nr:hypothetical protein PINS_up018329 [Pythium insidiosum]
MLPMMQRIVALEDHSLAGGVIEQALDAMHRVQEQLESVDLSKRQKYDRSCLRDDSGLQLVAICCRRLPSKCRRGDDVVDHQQERIRIPCFSRKALHFLIKFLIMQNGFYVAFLCQAVLYEFPELYHQFGVLAVVLIPLPLVLNMFVFSASHLPPVCGRELHLPRGRDDAERGDHAL